MSSKKFELAKIEEGPTDSFLTLYCPRATASNFEELFEIVDIETAVWNLFSEDIQRIFPGILFHLFRHIAHYAP